MKSGNQLVWFPDFFAWICHLPLELLNAELVIIKIGAGGDCFGNITMVFLGKFPRKDACFLRHLFLLIELHIVEALVHAFGEGDEFIMATEFFHLATVEYHDLVCMANSR